MKNQKGISLIALIITIIVIIILAAIVIGGVFNTPNDAKFANFCQEYDRVQTAIQLRYYDLYEKYAISVSPEIPTHYEIYNEIATGIAADTLTGASNIDSNSWVTIVASQWGTGTGKICSQPSLTGNWYVRLSDGKLAYAGFEKAEKDMYYTPTAHTTGNRTMQEVSYFNSLTAETAADSDTQSGLLTLLLVGASNGSGSGSGEQGGSGEGGSGEQGGNEPVANAISKETSYVGCFADVDGNGSIDGIIYVDLLAQAGASGQWRNGNGAWTIPSTVTSDNVKEYVVGETGAVDTRFGSTARDVIKPATGTTGSDRFYVMGLDNITDGTNTTLYWYKNAYNNSTNPMPTSPLLTSEDFGTGAANTSTMTAACNAGTYGTKDPRDMWQYVTSGWFIPSRGEWAAFASAFNITLSTYSSYGLSRNYWSSSQSIANDAWCASINNGGMYNFHVSNEYRVRLSRTF